MVLLQVKSATASAARQMSHRSARGSRSIKEATVALQACPHVRIANCVEHHEIDCSPHCLFERLAEAKEFSERCRQTPGLEFDKEVHVRPGRVEVQLPRRGAYDLEPFDTMQLAESFELRKSFL